MGPSMWIKIARRRRCWEISVVVGTGNEYLRKKLSKQTHTYITSSNLPEKITHAQTDQYRLSQ